LQVFRQWDGASCGYHALKNAMVILFALKYVPKTTDISTAILDLVKSPTHFWLLYFYWQSLLLLTADEKGADAKEKGRSVDIGKKISDEAITFTHSLTHPFLLCH